MPYERPPETIAVEVALNTGNTTALRSGNLCAIGIKAPSGVATYDIVIKDADGYGIFIKTGVTGNVTLSVDLQLYGSQIITIENATNGTYGVRLWFRP